MKLTIGIPVFNEKPYIDKTLDSIFCEARTCSEIFEILLIDNANTDGTSEWLSEIEKSYDLLKIFI